MGLVVRRWSSWLLCLSLILPSLVTGAENCRLVFKDLQANKKLSKVVRSIPAMPAPEAIESWFRSVYDPGNVIGESLILDQAFRTAFRRVLFDELDNAGLKPKQKARAQKQIDELIEALRRRATPLYPAVTSDPLAQVNRTSDYETAIREFLRTERFRDDWNKTLRANVPVENIEGVVRDFYLKTLNDPHTVADLQNGVSPFAINAITRDTLKRILIDRIDKAWLPAEEKGRIRNELEKALKAWEHEEGLRNAHRPPAENKEEPRELTDEEQAKLKKTLEEYFKSERFRMCVKQPLKLLAISETITAAGAIPTTVLIDSLIDGKGSFWDIFKGEKYVESISSSELQKQLVRNALLMTSIGFLGCVHSEAFGGDNRAMRWALSPNNFNGLVLSPMLATSAELMSGTMRPTNILMSTLWTRIISVNKTALANRMAEDYRRAGKSHPDLYYGFVQFVSELSGAIGFPLLNRAIFGPAPTPTPTPTPAGGISDAGVAVANDGAKNAAVQPTPTPTPTPVPKTLTR